MAEQSAYWLDGTPTTVVSLPDRGLDFGDGLFETLLLRGGQPLFLESHIERLALGLRALSLPNCLAAVREQLDYITQSLDTDWPWAALRLSVIRGPGPRGYAPAKNSSARILVTVNRIDRNCAIVSPAATMGVADIQLSFQPALARIKHLNRLEQVLAANQAQAQHVDECFVLDQSENLVSVIAGNVFLLRGGELLTPQLVNCGVAGTRRRRIIEKWAPAIGYTVRETNLTLGDLQNAEEVFYSNSLQTVRPVSRLGEQSWGEHAVCEALFQQYLAELS